MLALSGCASMAPQAEQSPEVEVPIAWSAAEISGGGGTLSLTRWWQRFDDTVLDTLVTQALQSNTSVETAQSVLQQARAMRDLAAAALWPTLTGSASAQHSRAGNNSGSNFQAGVNGNWIPDVFGANRSALDAGVATVGVALFTVTEAVPLMPASVAVTVAAPLPAGAV